MLNDASTWTDTSWYDVPNAWSAIEIHYQAFANSGSLTLWLDDSQMQSLTFVDNDTRPLTDVRLGAQGVDANTSGTLYFDDLESRRFSYIGTLTDPGVDDPQASNPAGWTASTYSYSASIPHAVTSVAIENGGTNSYEYDANGNMTCRIENGVVYTHTYNTENRASSIAKRNTNCSGTIIESWSFAYDGDGVRVMTAHFTGTSGTPDSTTSYYMGGAYEVKDGATKKYYSIAGMMVAVNDGTGLQYLLTDHLGSTVAVTNSSGTLTSQQRYLPFGAPRAIPNSPILGTDFTFTGQRDLGDMGLMDYDARFYSQSLGRFIQPDSVVPDPTSSQGWNRYSYTLNNPIRYNDPSGHCVEPLTFILCAAAIGAVVSVAIDAIVTTQVKHESYSVEKAVKAAATGAIAGAVGATVGLIGASVAAAAGATGFVATVVTGAIAGVASGQATRATSNVLSGRPLTEGLGNPKDLITDAVIGGLTSAAGYALGQSRSAIRYTEEGDEFLHYGYAEHAGNFDDGLRPGGYATPNNGSVMPPKSAASQLGLPNPELPDSYYIVRPTSGTAIQGPRPVSPIFRLRPPFFRPGFGTEVRFPNGTTPGSVVGPFPLLGY